MYTKPERLISLDAMRGYTIAAMILVNFPGSWDHVYPPLLHSQWNGLTLTDLIAPFFLFIVGVSVVLAYTRRMKTGIPGKYLYRKIFIRSFNIFAVGILLNVLALYPEFSFSDMRWTGTLPRIALVYLACSLIFLYTGWKGQVWTGGIILVSYWLIMTCLPTPGAGRVMLEPGVNIAAWLDSLLMPGRMWQGTWDPESILSTFPAIATGISGMLAGHILLSRQGKGGKESKALLLMVGGFLAAAAGYFWGLTFPVNENLWTSSFVLVTSGMASMTLGAAYYFVDIKGYRGGTAPGIIFGSNAITAFVLGDILALFFYLRPVSIHSLNDFFVSAMISWGFAPEFSSMLYAIMFVGVVFIPVWVLYRKRIYIKL
jgi:predicted acyltransferase